MKYLTTIHHHIDDCRHDGDVELYEVDDITLIVCAHCLSILERGLPVYEKR